MSVRIGLGIATFPFASVKNFWRWIELCEENGIDSFWQTDRAPLGRRLGPQARRSRDRSMPPWPHPQTLPCPQTLL